MRAEKISEFISVVMALHNSTIGLTYKDINELTENQSSRSAQRMVATIQTVFNVEVIESRNPANYKTKRFRLPKLDLAGLVRFSPDELMEMETAIDLLDQHNHPSGAKTIRGILDKIKVCLDNATTVESDLEFLRRSELAIADPGLRQKIFPAIFNLLREALLAEQEVEIEYQKVHSEVVSRFTVYPYGLIYGKRNYLVAFNPNFGDIRHYALTNIKAVHPSGGVFTRPADFDLSAHMADSIGVFREDPIDIVLRFGTEASADARNFHFHQSQKIKELANGSIEVYFRTGGLRELCYHLFTWGPAVQIVKPARLKKFYKGMLEEILKTFES